MKKVITATLIGGAITIGSLLGAGTANAADPYSSDGTWLVPTEIAPGTYRAIVRSDAYGGGYFKVCADYSCKIGTPGFIDNDSFEGSAILVVPPNAVSVELSDVELTRI